MKYLACVSSLFCTELCSEKTADGSTRIAFLLLPADDIVISKPLTVIFVIPSEYPVKGGLRIFCAHPGLFRLDNSSRTNSPLVTCRSSDSSSQTACQREANEVYLPWLATCKHEPAVHFYALRTLLKKPNEMPWETPYEIQHMFPTIAAGQHSGSGNGSQSPLRPYHTLLCGAGRTRGRRNYMEDVDFQFKDIKVGHVDGGTISLYGVLDGHGGQECAQHTSDELPTKLTAELRSKRPIAEALFTSYLKTDAEFLHISSDSQAGCTATVCVWDGANNRGYIGNAGDTRAVMCRGGVAVDLTIDKKATDPYEIARIYREGGFVSKGRVMGTLGVARAIGDCSLKHTSKRILISDPEITTFDYQQNADQFIVIASDGLWDVMSSQDAVNWINAKLTSHNIVKGAKRGEETINANLNSICGQLAKHADTELGSMDNITVMILVFTETLYCPDPLRGGMVSGRSPDYGGCGFAAVSSMDCYDNQVAMSSQPWDAVVRTYIKSEFEHMFDPNGTGSRCSSSSNTGGGKDASGYLSASLYGLNSQIYNDTMVDNLTLPKTRTFTTEHNSPSRKDSGLARTSSYTRPGEQVTHHSNPMSPSSLMVELDGLLLDSSNIFTGGKNSSKVAPERYHSISPPLDSAGTNNHSNRNVGSNYFVMAKPQPQADDADADMDFLLDDSNF